MYDNETMSIEEYEKSCRKSAAKAGPRPRYNFGK